MNAASHPLIASGPDPVDMATALLSASQARQKLGVAFLDVSNGAVEKLSACIAAIGTDLFWSTLHETIAGIVAHQMGAAFVYSELDPPVRVFDSQGSLERNELHQILAKIGYLISPYYNGLIRTGAEGGFYHIDEIAPDAFRQSEYFEAYYGRKKVADEGMFLCRIEDAMTLVFMVERLRDKDRFSKTELEELHILFPVVDALVKQHVKLAGLGDVLSPESRANRSAFRLIAERFGTDMLSNRERDVALLILRGHSSKSAARVLDISPETERVHRRRLYSKLGIGSHSELFWLFLQASDFFDPSTANDPLVDFLKAKHPDLFTKA